MWTVNLSQKLLFNQHQIFKGQSKINYNLTIKLIKNWNKCVKNEGG